MQIQTRQKVCQIFLSSREFPPCNVVWETGIVYAERSEPSLVSW